MVEDADCFVGADSIVLTDSLHGPRPPHPDPAGGGGGFGGGRGTGGGAVNTGLHPAHPSKHQTPATASSVVSSPGEE